MASTLNYPRFATRIFNTPLLISRLKLDAILTGLGPRLGLAIDGDGPDLERDKPEPRESETRKGVAVIPVTGTLVNRRMGMESLSGLTSYQSLAAKIQAAAADESVGGILLDIDSPGGEVAGLFDLVEKIKAADELKPVYAVANDSAFSAAYAIASSARKMFTTKTGGVGSIGVVAVHVDQSELDKEMGVKVTHIFRGDKKVEGNAHEPLSDEARGTIQAEVDQAFEMFVDLVAENRNMTRQQVVDTQAGLFFGERGVSAGLVDGLGGFDVAFEDLSELVEEDMEMREELATLRAENEELRDRLACLENEAENTRQEAIDEYLESLRTASAEANAPLTAEQIARVESLFDSDQDEVAYMVGDLLLEGCKKKEQPQFSRVDGDAEDNSKEAKKLATERAAARRLEAMGMKVKWNEGGTSFTVVGG